MSNDYVDNNICHDEYQIRKEKVTGLQENGKSAWPSFYEKKVSLISCVLDSFEKNISLEDAYAISGRIITIREHGKSIFIIIKDDSASIQVYIKKDPDNDFFSFTKQYLDRGDIVLVKGSLFLTKTGEKTIRVSSITLLSKCLLCIPTERSGLENIETRYRKRYLDIIMHDDVKDVFKKRSLLIQFIREFLNKNEYLEVETPMLHSIPGGALAKPFITKHNALDMNLFLRIAPELFLKRLIVAGFSKVYEINKNFRNEGVSVRHNPEFTMLEFYTAYKEYIWAMDFIEKMIKEALFFLQKSYIVEWNSHTVDFDIAFDRITAKQAIVKYTKFSESDLETNAIDQHIPHEKRELLYEEKLFYLFEEYAEDKLIYPTFIVDYPLSISPLAKPLEENSSIAARFELFICGMEISNGYNELNNPFDQEDRFKDQMIKKGKGDDEAMEYDKDFIEALRCGMPPTVGVGIGIDRLCMIFTNSKSIKDVILFPTMKSLSST